MIGIYKFTNKYNRKVYIGQSKNIKRRYKGHLRAADKGNEGHFYNALRQYGPEGFDFDILIECPKENLNYWEKFYIRYYCSNNRDFGYNMTSGGDGGFVRAEESNQKQREKMLGREPYNKGKTGLQTAWNKGIPCSDEQKEKQREKMLGKPGPNKGKKMTEESKEKNRIAHLGHPAWNKGISASDEQKEKQRQKMKGRIPWNKGLKKNIS